MATRQKTAIIIGAGPAGLTAALEFCRRSAIKPIVLEASDRIGGISCTIVYKGNRIDIGGHRFFSKSDRVMSWWTDLMPVAEGAPGADVSLTYHNRQRILTLTDTCREDESGLVMLVRPRRSRIYFMRHFFDYPLSLSAATLRNLGFFRTLRIGASYIKSRMFQKKPEKTLEDFLINRFGTELYSTFFKSYTEKVWGVPCEQISAAWGAQRIKGLSLRKALAHFFKKSFTLGGKKPSTIKQKDSETSLIEQFLYPKYGPGQLWEHAAQLVEELGGQIRTGHRVTAIHIEVGADGIDRVVSVEAATPSGELVRIAGDFFFSTMPVQELLNVLAVPVPPDIKAISDGLVYRDFITVGLLVDRLLITEPDGSLIKDNWIYIQEPDVLVGRIQVFNNWSPYLVADPNKVWIGLEYFCYDTDPLWRQTNADIAAFAIAEVAKIGILSPADVRDSCVYRVPKTYPAYFGTYDRFDEIVRYADRFENLFLVGRNGMHKYNNQDHSMLTAMVAVDNILSGITSKDNLWTINTEEQYHEDKDDSSMPPADFSVTDDEDETAVEEELTV